MGSTLKSLKPGGVSKPIQTVYGWSLLKVLRRRPYQLPPLERVKAPSADLLKRQLAEIETKAGDWAALNSLISGAARSAPLLRRLIQLGADISVRDSEGNTPLHLACLLGLTAEADVLIQAGAPLEAINKGGETPMHYAAAFDKTGTIVQRLLEKGVTARGKEDASGAAPIHLAAAGDNSEAIHALLQAGEDPDRPSSEGKTPLMSAAISHAPRAVAALATRGADPLKVLTDRSGKFPVDHTALDLYSLSNPPNSADAEAALAVLKQVTASAAVRASRATLKATILQDGKRMDLNGGVIHLRKKPFTLAFQVSGAARAGVVALDQSAKGATREFLLAHFRSMGYLAGKAAFEDANGRNLFLYSPDDPVGGYQSWSNSSERPDFTTFKAGAGGFSATREIDVIEEVPGAELPRAWPRLGRKVDLNGRERPKPMLLSCFVLVPMGILEAEITHQVDAEIRWVED